MNGSGTPRSSAIRERLRKRREEREREAAKAEDERSPSTQTASTSGIQKHDSTPLLGKNALSPKYTATAAESHEVRHSAVKLSQLNSRPPSLRVVQRSNEMQQMQSPQSVTPQSLPSPAILRNYHAPVSVTGKLDGYQHPFPVPMQHHYAQHMQQSQGVSNTADFQLANQTQVGGLFLSHHQGSIHLARESLQSPSARGLRVSSSINHAMRERLKAKLMNSYGHGAVSDYPSPTAGNIAEHDVNPLHRTSVQSPRLPSMAAGTQHAYSTPQNDGVFDLSHSFEEPAGPPNLDGYKPSQHSHRMQNAQTRWKHATDSSSPRNQLNPITFQSSQNWRPPDSLMLDAESEESDGDREKFSAATDGEHLRRRHFSRRNAGSKRHAVGETHDSSTNDRSGSRAQRSQTPKAARTPSTSHKRNGTQPINSPVSSRSTGKHSDSSSQKRLGVSKRQAAQGRHSRHKFSAGRVARHRDSPPDCSTMSSEGNVTDSPTWLRVKSGNKGSLQDLSCSPSSKEEEFMSPSVSPRHIENQEFKDIALDDESGRAALSTVTMQRKQDLSQKSRRDDFAVMTTAQEIRLSRPRSLRIELAEKIGSVTPKNVTHSTMELHSRKLLPPSLSPGRQPSTGHQHRTRGTSENAAGLERDSIQLKEEEGAEPAECESGSERTVNVGKHGTRPLHFKMMPEYLKMKAERDNLAMEIDSGSRQGSGQVYSEKADSEGKQKDKYEQQSSVFSTSHAPTDNDSWLGEEETPPSCLETVLLLFKVSKPSSTLSELQEQFLNRSRRVFTSCAVAGVLFACQRLFTALLLAAPPRVISVSTCLFSVGQSLDAFTIAHIAISVIAFAIILVLLSNSSKRFASMAKLAKRMVVLSISLNVHAQCKRQTQVSKASRAPAKSSNLQLSPNVSISKGNGDSQSGILSEAQFIKAKVSVGQIRIKVASLLNTIKLQQWASVVAAAPCIGFTVIESILWLMYHPLCNSNACQVSDAGVVRDLEGCNSVHYLFIAANCFIVLLLLRVCMSLQLIARGCRHVSLMYSPKQEFAAA